jgi:excisionase family DNA binding protein
MKFEIEPQDIEAIAQRVAEIIRPMVLHQKRDEKDIIFDVPGLAEYLHVNPSWVYKAVSLKSIPYFKAGKFPRFRKKDIDRWAENKAVRPILTLKMIKTRGMAT